MNDHVYHSDGGGTVNANSLTAVDSRTGELKWIQPAKM
jgi:hypothetical protein